MNIDLSKQMRAEATTSLRRYFEANMPEPLGELPASLLLNFFLEEVGPAVYNQAVTDAQTHLQQRLADLSGELYHDPLQYWPRLEAKRKSRR